MSRPTILFLVTEDWYFWSHRLDLARAALTAGFDVVLGSRFRAHRARIEASGIRCIELPFERSLRRPFADLRLIFAIAATVRRLRPAIVHTVALKPILLSALAVRQQHGTQFCHAVTGMGYLFISQQFGARMIRAFVVPLLRRLLARQYCWLVVQNREDLADLGRSGIVDASRTVVIPGAGVDTERFRPTPLPGPGAPLIVLPARMLRDKGVGEFVAAAHAVQARGVQARFALVGATDPDNPAALTECEIAALCADGVVAWWRHRDDMPAVYAEATIVCLPSYREGLPKVLLEAAASGRPLLATDVPGCNEICRDGETGRAVPPRDVGALAEAIAGMLARPAQLARYAANARALVEREFSAAVIHAQTLALYRRMLAAGAAAGGS